MFLLKLIWKAIQCCRSFFFKIFARQEEEYVKLSPTRPGDGLLKVTCAIIVIFLVFNTEFVNAISGAPHRTSISLGGALPPFPPFSEPEMWGVEWLLTKMNPSLMVYGDSYGHIVFRGYLKRELVQTFFGVKYGQDWQISNPPPSSTYIYLTHLNLEDGKVFLTVGLYQYGNVVNLTDITFLHYRSKIYSNGYSEIYR
jgi:uncharacterized membrane protein